MNSNSIIYDIILVSLLVVYAVCCACFVYLAKKADEGKIHLAPAILVQLIGILGMVYLAAYAEILWPAMDSVLGRTLMFVPGGIILVVPWLRLRIVVVQKSKQQV